MLNLKKQSKQKDNFMINSNFLALYPDDFDNFKKDLASYKARLIEMYSQPPMTIQQFKNFEEENSAISDNIILKYAYHFYSNADEKITEVFQSLIQENQILTSELFQSKDFYEFAKNLIVEDDQDAVVKKRILKGFENAGLNLSEEKQKELNEIRQNLSVLSIKYNKNISDHKENMKLFLDEELKSIITPEDLELFKGQNFIKYNQHLFMDIGETATTELLRKKVYEISKSIASEGSEFDNTNVIKEILATKQKLAVILGKKDYTEVQMEERMAKNSQEVIDFLYNVNEKIYPLAKKENEEFEDFIKNNFGVSEIEFHNRPFYSNKYDKQKFDYNKDEERTYFSLKSTQEVVFETIENLFNITFKKDEDIKLPYEDTEAYRVYNNGIYKGIMITDFYLRDKKNQGAWVSALQAPSVLEEGIVSINANLDKTKEGLSISDIVTLFHEYGHLVHTFSSSAKYSSLSGTSGMARDAVEIPSQMLEQYGKEKNILKYIAKKTGKAIPDSLVDKLLDMENDGKGSFYSRQISFALYDMIIHKNPDSDPNTLFNEISKQVIPREIDPTSNFPNRFSHIFSGGYSAGYYGYMWADVYSIDAYMHVKESEENKQKFKEFLAKGSSQDAEEIYVAFRGQKASVENFLNYYGIETTPTLSKKLKR